MSRRKSVYEGIADGYAATVDTKPHNAAYERPTMLSLLPPLAGLRVLDVGCGSGWYARQLLERGARVTSFDVEPRFVELTRERVGDRAEVLVADLAAPLDFADDGAFDLAICPLVLHYVRDWRPVLQELHRTLAPGGLLLFSTHHPFMDWRQFATEDYFATEPIEDDWGMGRVTFYRRPLTAMSEDLAAAGFVIERLLEPRPTAEFREADPEGHEKLMKNPWFLVIRARKTDAA